MQLKEHLKDAYFGTPKCKDQRKYVKFQYKGHMIHYKKKLPFWLVSGSRLSQK